MKSTEKQLFLALGAIAGVILVGTAGYAALEGWSFIDRFMEPVVLSHGEHGHHAVSLGLEWGLVVLSVAAAPNEGAVKLAETFGELLGAIALAVSAIPEGLPVALTVALAVDAANTSVTGTVTVTAPADTTCAAGDLASAAASACTPWTLQIPGTAVVGEFSFAALAAVLAERLADLLLDLLTVCLLLAFILSLNARLAVAIAETARDHRDHGVTMDNRDVDDQPLAVRVAG